MEKLLSPVFLLTFPADDDDNEDDDGGNGQKRRAKSNTNVFTMMGQYYTEKQQWDDDGDSTSISLVIFLPFSEMYTCIITNPLHFDTSICSQLAFI